MRADHTLRSRQVTRRVAVTVVVIACSSPEGGSDVDPNAAFAPWALAAPTVRIGGAESRGGAQLSSVKQVVPFGGDSIFVTDAGITAVLVFDGRGMLARQIGRPGQGPGEFGFVTAIGRLGDTLWVTDRRRRRVYFFRRDGSVHRSWPMFTRAVTLPDGGMRTVIPRAVLAGGSMVGFLPVIDSLPATAPPAPPHGAAGFLGYFDSLGVARDTLLWLTEGGGRLLVMFVGDNIHFPGPHHFEAAPLWTVADDGSSVAVVDRPPARDSATARYGITKWDARGERMFSMQIRYTPVPVPPALVDSLAEDYAADMGTVSAPVAATTIVRDSLRVPRYFPPVSDVVIGSNGHIWIAREGLIPPPFTRRRYDVLDTSGRPAGTLTLPQPGKIMAATSDAVWVVEHDTDDVPTLLRYPIVKR